MRTHYTPILILLNIQEQQMAQATDGQALWFNGYVLYPFHEGILWHPIQPAHQWKLLKTAVS